MSTSTPLETLLALIPTYRADFTAETGCNPSGFSKVGLRWLGGASPLFNYITVEETRAVHAAFFA
jgi:hypothetical protein